MRLGRLPARRPVGLADLFHYLHRSLPAAPAACDPPQVEWGMLGNDQYGDCVAEGTLVSAGHVGRAYRSRYVGPMIRLSFESGNHLSVTPNHAVMTPAGFVRARFLQEGDDVISTSFSRGLFADVDFYQPPARIEDVTAALAARSPRASILGVVRPVDFHGDGRHMDGNVEVVGAHSLLGGELDSSLSQPHRHNQIPPACQLQRGLHGESTAVKRRWHGFPAPSGSERRLSLGSPFSGGHRRVAQSNNLGHVAEKTEFHQGPAKLAGVHTSLFGQSHVAFSLSVSADEIGHVGSLAVMEKAAGGSGRSSLVASRVHPSAEGGRTDLYLASDLAKRFSGLIETDRLVKIDWERYDGHVFDLGTSDRWYCANGILVHNCTLAGVVHLRMANAADHSETESFPDTDIVVAQYLQMTGGADGGLVEADVLQTWHTTGLFGDKVDGYAPFDHRNQDELRQVTALFGGAYLGVAIPAPAQQQFASGQPWDLTGTDADRQIEGGHAVPVVGYDPQFAYVITWGRVQPVAWRWLGLYLEEGWCVLTSEDADAAGVNLAVLQADLAALT